MKKSTTIICIVAIIIVGLVGLYGAFCIPAALQSPHNVITEFRLEDTIGKTRNELIAQHGYPIISSSTELIYECSGRQDYILFNMQSYCIIRLDKNGIAYRLEQTDTDYASA